MINIYNLDEFFFSLANQKSCANKLQSIAIKYSGVHKLQLIQS